MVVNLEEQTFHFESISGSVYEKYLGGRGINAHYAYANQIHLENAFSENNKILLAPGALTGMPCLYANRMTITSKSPLTNLLGDSNIGGDFPIYLKWAEIDQVVIEGKSDKPVLVVISKTKCLFWDAEFCWGKDTDETQILLKERIPQSKYVSALVIGPAGENKVRYASIHSGSHAAGRTGLGAIMGDKNLKGIVVKGSAPKFSNFEESKIHMKYLDEIVRKDPTFHSASLYGATTAIEGFNKIGVLEVKNLTTGVWEDHHKISGKYLRDTFTIRRYGCPFCNIRCKGISKFNSEEFGEYEVHGPEFAALQNYGARIVNSDLPSVCYLTKISNQKGIDLMSMGGILSWLMECLEKEYIAPKDLDNIELGWGKVPECIELIKKIAVRENIGNVLAEGSERASNFLGVLTKNCLLTVKKMEFEGCDPRGYKGRGVGFAVSSRGADNCRSLSAFESVISEEEARIRFGSEEAAILTGVKGKGKLLKFIEDYTNVADLLGLCRYGMYVFASNVDSILQRGDLIGKYFDSISGFGQNVGYEGLVLASERTINLERVMLLENGCTKKDDLLPERFRKIPMPEGPAEGNVVENEQILMEYYKARGWTSTGVIKKQKQENIFGEVLYSDKEI